MEKVSNILLLAGTFLPIYGVALTIFLAIILKTWMRALALTLMPLLTYGLCLYFGSAIAYNGNMLYVALFVVFIIALCIYYPALLVLSVILFLRSRKGAV